MTTLKDPMGRAIIDFFRSQGVKFVDIRTGKEVFNDDEPSNNNNNKGDNYEDKRTIKNR